MQNRRWQEGGRLGRSVPTTTTSIKGLRLAKIPSIQAKIVIQIRWTALERLSDAGLQPPTALNGLGRLAGA